LLLLNKIDVPEGEQNFPEWRTLHPGAIPISAKTGRGIDQLLASVLAQFKGQMVEATLEADSANGKLLAFIETHCQILDRKFKGRKIILRATMSKRVYEDLSRNEQVTVKVAEAL
jgi:GTP-binding protein HflX